MDRAVFHAEPETVWFTAAFKVHGSQPSIISGISTSEIYWKSEVKSYLLVIQMPDVYAFWRNHLINTDSLCGLSVKAYQMVYRILGMGHIQPKSITVGLSVLSDMLSLPKLCLLQHCKATPEEYKMFCPFISYLDFYPWQMKTAYQLKDNFFYDAHLLIKVTATESSTANPTQGYF